MLRGLGLAVVVGAVATLVACSADEGGGTAGTGGSEGGGPTFGDSTCFACLSPACAKEQAACASDPGCAAYLSCSKACPPDPNGYVATACESSCPAGDTSAAQAARAALLACYQTGAGQSCSACGFGTDAGTDSGSHPVLNQQCTPPSTAPDLCDRCLDDHCCESSAALAKPGPGSDLYACWLACNDWACQSDCYDKYPGGISDLGSWWACLGVKCIGPESCTSSGACSKCNYKNCGNEFANCVVDSECFVAYSCMGNCGDTTCVEDCRKAHPNAKQRFDELALCLSVKCSTEC